MAKRSMVNLRVARKPKLGQNFLADHRAAERIVDALGEVSESCVIEIGPGRGALTDLLAKRARRVVAIELDRLLAAQLRTTYANQANVEILQDDVLRVDFRAVGPNAVGQADSLGLHGQERAKLLGNLPYYITSDILLHLFDFHEQFDLMVMMVQREVGTRIAASPGSRDYGLLSATTQLYAGVENLFTLPPGAFTPPPKVHSSVLRLRVRSRFEQLGVKPEAFIGFLRLAFAMKRKTLMNNLKSRYPQDQIKPALEQAGIRADARAEALTLEETAKIFKALENG